jgi:hypothetical protein
MLLKSMISTIVEYDHFLQGGVRFPTGGKVRERKHEPVQFRYRRYLCEFHTQVRMKEEDFFVPEKAFLRGFFFCDTPSE